MRAFKLKGRGSAYVQLQWFSKFPDVRNTRV